MNHSVTKVGIVLSVLSILPVVSDLFLVFLSRVAKERVPIIKMEIKDGFCHEGVGGSRGGLECHLPILKNDFFKNHLESFPDCENVCCT